MKKLNFLSIFLIFLIIPVVFAQTQNVASTETVTSPGITPDSPLWIIDRASERISLALTFGAEAKAKKGLEIAQERLSEADKMIAENKLDSAEKATEAHKQIISNAQANIAALKETDNLDTIVDFENRIDNQQDKIDEIRARVEIKINGQLTPDQKAKLAIFLDSLDSSTNSVKLELGRKEDLTIAAIRKRTGRNAVDVENEIDRLKERAIIEAKIFGNSSRVKIERRFTIRMDNGRKDPQSGLTNTDVIPKQVRTTANANDLVKKIIKKFSLNEEKADSLLRIKNSDETENEIENQNERLGIKVEIKERGGVSFARVQIKSQFISGSDRQTIIKDIVSNTKLTREEILNSIGFDRQKEAKDNEKNSGNSTNFDNGSEGDDREDDGLNENGNGGNEDNNNNSIGFGEDDRNNGGNNGEDDNPSDNNNTSNNSGSSNN